MCKLNITETSQKHHRYYLMPVSYTIVTLVESFLHFLTVKPLNDHKFKGKRYARSFLLHRVIDFHVFFWKFFFRISQMKRIWKCWRFPSELEEKIGRLAFKNRIKEQNHSKSSKPSKSAIFVMHLLPLKTFYANLQLLAYSLLRRVQGQVRGRWENSLLAPLPNAYAVDLSIFLLSGCLKVTDVSYSQQLIRPEVYIIYPNPHGLCHLRFLPTEITVIARTQALPNMFYSWL